MNQVNQYELFTLFKCFSKYADYVGLQGIIYDLPDANYTEHMAFAGLVGGRGIPNIDLVCCSRMH